MNDWHTRVGEAEAHPGGELMADAAHRRDTRRPALLSSWPPGGSGSGSSPPYSGRSQESRA
jgi:hypothetical protein